MPDHERWTSLAAEYENSCAKLTLIKPEIKPVFCHTLKQPVIKPFDRKLEEYRRMKDALHAEDLRRMETDAKGLMDAYAYAAHAAAKRHSEQGWTMPPPKRFKRTGAKL